MRTIFIRIPHSALSIPWVPVTLEISDFEGERERQREGGRGRRGERKIRTSQVTFFRIPHSALRIPDYLNWRQLRRINTN
jgi:hypothetical protein